MRKCSEQHEVLDSEDTTQVISMSIIFQHHKNTVKENLRKLFKLFSISKFSNVYNNDHVFYEVLH